MKSILLHVNDDPGQESRLLATLALVRQHGARLTCVQVTPISDYVVTDPFGGMYQVQTLLEQLANRAVEARSHIEARLANEGFEWDWSVYDGDVAGTIVQRSQLSDLVVVSQADNARGHRPRPQLLVADIALHVRTPVLAVPIAAPAFNPGGLAMIAWNGSPEAGHAVRAALPMLKMASRVQVVTFDENEETSKDDVQQYLAAHGIATECAIQHLDGKSVGEALCLAATTRDAAFVVMGAYGHSRLREAVLGGVSRHMMAQSTVPLLLAH